MSLIANNIKSILAIKIKPRHDSYTDQFCRIFMPKMFIISCLVMGVDWFHDTVACMVPKDSHLSGSFVHSACWIQGFYVFPEMMNRLEECNYYGIPKNMNQDGQLENGDLCETMTRQGMSNPDCKPMTKRYYLQFQWMPFYIASLALLFYMPYVLFRIVNTDMISLRDTLTKEQKDADELVRNYFNYHVNSVTKLRIRVIMNAFVKLLYIVVNVLGFVFTNDLLIGNFKNYGFKWAEWSRLNHTSAFDFFEGDIPKPGNVLLPSFGYCEIQEAHMDIRNVFFNTNKFICEISPNILYQYTFIVLWFCMVLSIMISIIGFLINVLGHVVTVTCFLRNGNPARQIYKILTLRECEYLTFIRRKNIPLYGDILRKLKESREDMKLVNGNIDHYLNGTPERSTLLKSGSAPPDDTQWSKL